MWIKSLSLLLVYVYSCMLVVYYNLCSISTLYAVIIVCIFIIRGTIYMKHYCIITLLTFQTLFQNKTVFACNHGQEM